MFTLRLISLLLVICLGAFGQESGTIIPLYIYPRTNSGRNAWQRLFDAYEKNPIPTWAIVNVYNGPGTSQDSNYVSAIDNLHSKGMNSMGYVYTNYTRRSQAEVKADIDLWQSFYKVKGIFFDEMTNDDNDLNLRYYQELNDYVKGKGFTFTVGNPGTRTNAKYFETVDNIIVYEEPGLPSKDMVCGQNTNGKGRGSVSIIPYGVRRLNEGRVRDLKTCSGFIYVTDDTFPNPWDTLPAYLTQLFGILKG